MTTTETVVRLCEYIECDDVLVRSPGESHPHFAARRYCSQAHSAAARRKAPAPKPRPNPGLNASPPPFVPRIENGTWRPNAPGWPATPRIPATPAKRNAR